MTTPFTRHFTTRDSLRDLVEVDRAGTPRQIAFVEGGFQLVREPGATAATLPAVITAVRVCAPKLNVYFTGLAWGYGGEGPRGLCTLLHYLGMPVEAAQEYVMQRLSWGTQPEATDFPAGGTFLCTWRLERSSWMPTSPQVVPTARRRTRKPPAAPRASSLMPTASPTFASAATRHAERPISEHLLEVSPRPLALAIDHLLHRHIPGLESQKAVAEWMGQSPSYLSLLRSGKRVPTAELAAACLAGLARVPGLPPADLAFMESAFTHAIRHHDEEQATRTATTPVPASPVDPLVAVLEARIQFLESDEQPEDEPLADNAVTIVAALVTAALRADLYAYATRSNGQLVNLVQDHRALPHPQPLWVVEVRCGARLGREDEDHEYSDPELAARKFIELVGPWTALNAIRRTLLTER